MLTDEELALIFAEDNITGDGDLLLRLGLFGLDRDQAEMIWRLLAKEIGVDAVSAGACFMAGLLVAESYRRIVEEERR